MGRTTKLSGKVGSERIPAAKCSQSELALCTLQSAAKVPLWKNNKLVAATQLCDPFAATQCSEPAVPNNSRKILTILETFFFLQILVKFVLKFAKLSGNFISFFYG